MRRFKTVVTTSILSLGLAAGALQSANAANPNAVIVAGQLAAKNALSKGWKGHIATCRIAVDVRRAAVAAGYKKGTLEYQTIVRNTVYRSAKGVRSANGDKIENLLENEVVLDCKNGAAPAGLPRIGLLPKIAAGIAGVGVVAAIANTGDNGGGSNRAPSE